MGQSYNGYYGGLVIRQIGVQLPVVPPKYKLKTKATNRKSPLLA